MIMQANRSLFRSPLMLAKKEKQNETTHGTSGKKVTKAGNGGN